MKKILLVLLIVLLLGCSSCDIFKSYKVQIFVINYTENKKEYETVINNKKVTVKENSQLQTDFENKRFKWVFDTNNNNVENCFYLYFDYNAYSYEELINCNEFTYYTSTGEELVFNENNKYVFTGSIVIYISYADADEKIIEGINSYDMGMYFLINNDIWEFDTSLYDYENHKKVDLTV